LAHGAGFPASGAIAPAASVVGNKHRSDREKRRKWRILGLVRSNPLREAAADDTTKREELKNKRNLLFERYLKNPEDTNRALEIKIIDDQVAEYTRQIDSKAATKS
jgi:hypothetical protein